MKMKRTFNEAGMRIYKTISNQEICTVLLEDVNGNISEENEGFICNINDDDFEDKIDEFEENWKEVNWSRADWADYYGCDEDDVDDCMEEDFKDY